MKLHFFSLILYLCSFIFIAQANQFKVEDCSNGRGIATIDRFSLSPDPISLSRSVSATINITLHEDIPPNSYVKNKIYKITSLFGIPLRIPVPCIRGVGSCFTESCSYFNGYKTQICPFVPSTLKCDCPFKAGIYSGSDVTFRMPQLGPFIKFFASGNFRTEWRLVKKEDSTEKELACFVFTGRAIS